MDVNLKVNDYEVSLGMPLNPSGLAGAGIRKMGFLANAFMPIKKFPGDTLYWIKNPVISCFDERVEMCSPRDRSMDADMMYGTAAYLFFNRNGLRYVILQVMASYFAADMFTSSLREAASEMLGPAEKCDYTDLPCAYRGITSSKPFHLRYAWLADGQSLVSEIGPSGKSAFLHWQHQ